MRAEKQGSVVRLSFKYDEALISHIKTIPGRRYDAKTKTWSIPVQGIKKLAEAYSVNEGTFYPGEPLNPYAFYSLNIRLQPDRIQLEGPSDQAEYLVKSLQTLTSEDLINANGSEVFFTPGLRDRIAKFLSRYRCKNFEIITLPDVPEPYLHLSAELDARPYQKEALKLVSQGLRRATLVLPTGAGKTALAAMITAHFRLPTLFLTYSLDLVRQTRKAFEEILCVPVGVIAQGKIDLRPVTVATVQTVLSRAEELKEFLGEVKVLFVDEGHMLGAETIYKAATLASPVCAYALTATPERADGKDIYIEAAAGPAVVLAEDAVLCEEGYILPVRVEIYKVTHKPNTTSYYPALYKRHILHPQRTRFVAEITKTKPGPKLVLVKEIVHGEALSELLSAPFVHGKTPAAEREDIFRRFREKEFDTLIASPIAKQGIDLPEAQTLILAHGGGSKIEVKQKIGRVRRPAPGKKEALVVDFFDEDKGLFEILSKKRISLYKAEGYNLVYVDKTINLLPNKLKT